MMNTVPVERKRKETPAVIASYPSLCRGLQEFKVRLLQYPTSEPIIDIREFVVSDMFKGFSKKGVTLNLQQLIQLRDMLEPMIKDMEALMTTREAK
jgi:hypothetical protein